MRIHLIVVLSLGLLSSACGLLLPSPSATCDPERQSCDQVWVAVTGPAGWQAQQDYVLEIGALGWPIEEGAGGGVVAVEVAEGERVSVRLVQPQLCHRTVEFSALPGSNWVIRFAADGTPTVEDWTGRAMDLGPGLGEGRPSGCVLGAADLFAAGN